MSTLTTTSQLTLLELAKRIDPRGEAAKIANILAEDNEVLTDAQWGEANNITSHKVVRVDYLPTGTWRGVNQGVPKEASTTTQVNEPIGLLESYSDIDKAVVDMSPNPRQTRMTEASFFIEGMGQTLASAIMYGDHAADPLQLHGLAPRMNSLSSARVVGGGGTGADLTSVYVVQWGLDKVFMCYPRGSKTVGIDHEDLGEVTLLDSSSNQYQGFKDHFISRCGLVVRNSKCIARVANIESAGSSNLFNEDDLITVLNQMRSAGKGATIYVNATIKTQMEIALVARANVNFSVVNGLGGVPVLTFRGLPVRLVEKITNTESAIT